MFNRFFLQRTPLLIPFLLLTACGGGGSDSGDAGATNSGSPISSSRRLISSELDFDNNGIKDAEETYTYTDAGYLEQYHYIYLGDGADDLSTTETPPYTSSIEKTENYTYDDNNRVNTYEVIELVGSPTFFSQMHLVITYNYDGEKVLGYTQESFNDNGNLQFRLFHEFVYNSNDQVERIDISNDDTISPSGNGPNFQNRFYDSAGRLERTETVNGNSTIATITYSYTDDDQIDQWKIFSGNQTTIGEIRERAYDVNNCLKSELVGIYSSGNISPRERLNFYFDGPDASLSRVEFDAVDNGTIEAIRTVVTEAKQQYYHELPGLNPAPRLLLPITCNP